MNSKSALLFLAGIAFMSIHSLIFPINQERLDLYSPLTLTGNGIKTFFSKTFNMAEFSQDIFPNDLSSLVQCLRYAKSRPQPLNHAKHVLRLFSTIVRRTNYINASAASLFLEDATPIFKSYVQDTATKNFDLLQQAVNKLLCDAFVHQFASFKEKPTAFLHELSGSIVDSICDQEQIVGDIPLEDFRTAVNNFIELSLDKLIWHPGDGIQTWKLTKTIATELSQLAEVGVLTDDALQDLYNALTTRYCYFLDLVGTDLPTGFFETMKQELSSQTIPLIDSGALENCIKTNRQCLMTAVLEAEAKSAAERIVA